MRRTRFFTRRRLPSKKWAIATMIALTALPMGSAFQAPVNAQGPVGNGFSIDADDLRFIFKQIQVAQANATGVPLLGSGPNQVNAEGNPLGDPQLPMGLRTVDGSYNNLVPIPDQHLFG